MRRGRVLYHHFLKSTLASTMGSRVDCQSNAPNLHRLPVFLCAQSTPIHHKRFPKGVSFVDLFLPDKSPQTPSQILSQKVAVKACDMEVLNRDLGAIYNTTDC